MTTNLGRRLLLCLLLWFGAGLVLTPAVHGQEGPNQAGLIIQYGDGTTSTACVNFEESSITGLELLRRAGISVSADVSSGLGTTICALDGQGCNYPEENCFCQCQGATCVYWQYWYLADGEWQYSQIGATDREVTDGSVNGWVWAEGDPSGGQRPPATSFTEICAAEPAETPSGTSTQAVQPAPASTATPVLTPTGTSAPAAPGDEPSAPLNCISFTVIIFTLAGLMVTQLRRS